MATVRFACFCFLIFGSLTSPGQFTQGARTIQRTAREMPRSDFEATPGFRNAHADNYGKLPLSFEANRGQTDTRVKFLSRGSGYDLFLTNDEAIFSLRGGRLASSTAATGQLRPARQEASSDLLRMKLMNANTSARLTGERELAGKSNYFVGNDPNKWRSNIPNYARLKCEHIYPGIDLVYYGNQSQLEYDFVVAPGANPHRIQLDVRGASKIREDGRGDLVLQMRQGDLRWHRPVAYQEKDGARQEIAAKYVVKGKNRVGFDVDEYDQRRTLFIDPLIYSTFLGGSRDDHGNAVSVDSSGSVYVTGYTASTNFPTMSALQRVSGGGVSGYDVFVTKLDPSGSALVYSTYLGGSADDVGWGIAVDNSGNAYVTGGTDSPNFPTVNTLQPFGHTGKVFVTKLDPSGSTLVYSTFLGGSGLVGDYGTGVAVDSLGNVYVIGITTSPDFPTLNPVQPNFGGGFFGDGDAFVTKINAAGSALVYSTYLGGRGDDGGWGIAVDSSGEAYVTGFASSTDFPVVNPLQACVAGGSNDDAFVAKLDTSGSMLVYSTCLGGKGFEVGRGVAVDNEGNAYIAGSTGSADFPVVNAMQSIFGGGLDGDAFVAKLNPSGTAWDYATYLGGSGNDDADGIAVDTLGNAYITGRTYSTNFPTMHPLQPVIDSRGNRPYVDAFVTKLNPFGALAYSSYLGGSNVEQGVGIAVDKWESAYVVGTTYSSDFPSANPLQLKYGGAGDAFVTKVSLAAVTIVGSPELPLTKDGKGNFVALVTISNNGEITIPSVQVTIAGTKLGSAPLLSAPTPITNLAPGTSAMVQLQFPPSAAASTATVATLKVSGTYSVPAVPLSGKWSASFRSVSLE